MVAAKDNTDASDLPAAHRWLQKLARHMLLDPLDRDDLVQETLAELCMCPRNMIDWRTYLAAVLRNKARMLHRGEGRRRRRESEADVFAATDVRPNDQRLDDTRLAARIVAEIEALSEPYRTTLRLRYYEDLEPIEIARHLGVPAPTVRKRHQLAIQRLRERLDQSGDRELWRAGFALLLKLPPRSVVEVGALRWATWGLPALAAGTFALAWVFLSTGAPCSGGSVRSVSAQTVRRARERNGLGVKGDAKSQPPSARSVPSAHVQVSGEVPPPTPASAKAGPQTPSMATGEASGATAESCPSLQRLIDGAPTHAVVHVPACVYRESLVIKRPVTLQAAPGAQVRGSDVWRAFAAEGQLWRSDGKLPPPGTDMRCGSERPCTPQVFVDGEPLRLVASLPSPGQFMVGEAGEIWLAANPEGHEVEVVTRPLWLDVVASDVSFSGFSFAHALHPQHPLRVPRGMRRIKIEGNRFAHGAGVGVRLSGQGIRFENNVLEHFEDVALVVDRAEDVVIVGNRITSSGPLGASKLTSWTHGGVAVVLGQNVQIERNEILDNRGHGLWLIHSQRVNVENNRIAGNRGSGVVVQATWHAAARGNTLLRNGLFAFPAQPALLVAESHHIDIRANTLADHAINFIARPLAGVAHQDPCTGASHLHMEGNTFALPISFDSSFQANWSCGSLKVQGNRIYALYPPARTELAAKAGYTLLSPAAWRAHMASL